MFVQILDGDCRWRRRCFELLVICGLLTPLNAVGGETPARVTDDDDLPIEDIKAFAEVFEQIRASYVQPVSEHELLENAIRGMLRNLDPHSAYLDAKAFADLRETTTGHFGGIGIEVGYANDQVTVVAPIDGSPAALAGILPGDHLLEINGNATAELTMSEIVDAMRGPPGSQVTLKLRRAPNRIIPLTLIRADVAVASVRAEILEPGYGYVRISQFQIATAPDFLRAVNQLESQNRAPLRGLVIDLRNNPGGVLGASVDVVDAFLDEGLIVFTRGRLRESQLRFTASRGQVLPNALVTVLINRGSASASEVVAGALQDHGRATIVGTRSYGKGSVQSVLPLPGDRGLKLTTSRYYTPNGRSIQDAGITPDIPVPPLSSASSANGSTTATGDGRESTAARPTGNSYSGTDRYIRAALAAMKLGTPNQG